MFSKEKQLISEDIKMNKIGLLIVIGLILTFKVDAKRVEGKLLLKHDTLDVIFKIPVGLFTQEIDFEKIQRKIKYFNSMGEKVVIRPEQAEEIRFKYKHEEIRMLSRISSKRLNDLFSKNQYYFLKLEIDGKMKLFRYFYSETSPGAYDASTDGITGGHSYSASKYILQRLGEEIYIPKNLSFRKEMMKYFQDCPVLSLRIENREFRKRDLDAIVRYYNSHCMY
jgi:hypothetical protein